jgi:hypothetical protein
MTFAELISRAFQLWWRRKSLWVVGVILALCGRGAYSFSVNFQQRLTPGDPAEIERYGDLVPAWLIEQIVPILLGLALLGLLLWLITGLLAAWAGAAMVQLSDAADRDEPLSVGAAFGRGRPYALRLFGLELLVTLPILVLSLALLAVFAGAIGAVLYQIFAGAMDGEGTGALPLTAFSIVGGVLCLIPLFLLVGLLGALLGLLAKLAGRACVLEGLGIRAGLARAWGLARRSFGYLLLLWIMLIALGGVFSLVAGLPALGLLLIAGPALLGGEFGAGAAVAIAALAGYVLLVGVLLGGALTALNEMLWTLAYRWFVARATPAQAPAPTYS